MNQQKDATGMKQITADFASSSAGFHHLLVKVWELVAYALILAVTLVFNSMQFPK